MKKILFFIVVILIIGCVKEEKQEEVSSEEIDLPKPKLNSDFSIEEALSERRAVRSFRDEALSLEEISQLLWAAQGIDGVTGATRTAPSAGATQPLEVYLVVKNVNGLDKGVYHYNPKKHSITLVSSEEIEESYYNAPVFIIIAAVYERTMGRYGNRGIRYVNIEVGHVAQNIHLQALSLGLGSFPIGAFNDGEIKEMLGIEDAPLYIIPIGKV